MTTSFIEMNNQGVLRMGDRDYEKASKLFRSALALVTKVIASNSSSASHVDMPTANAGDHKQTVSSSESLSVKKEANQMDNKTKPKRKTSPNDSSSCTGNDSRTAPSRKRRRTEAPATSANARTENGNDISTSNTSTTDAPLGRLLWLDEPKQTPSQATLTVLASSMMYNYACALHRMGMDVTRGNQRMAYQKWALMTYTKAIRLSSRTGAQRSPLVKFLSCHNLQHLLLLIKKQQQQHQPTKEVESLSQKIRGLENEMVDVLRTTFSRDVRPDAIYLAVLSLLGIGADEGADSPAAAA